MLWLAFYFPDLPLKIFMDNSSIEGPIAIIHRKNNQEVIACCNKNAINAGIYPGLRLQAAFAICDHLEVHKRNLKLEEKFLENMAHWAYKFSSQISFEPSILLLEIGASLNLFGGYNLLLRKIKKEIKNFNLVVNWSISPTPMASSLLARNKPGIRVTKEQLIKALEAISISELINDRQAQNLINNIGLYNIGECLHLPRAELSRRIGPNLLLLFDRLLGKVADPRKYWKPPIYFYQRINFTTETSQYTGLMFPAKRLITSLCGFLCGCDKATQHLNWEILHSQHTPTYFNQRLNSPSRSIKYILKIFCESIEHRSLALPAIGVCLKVTNMSSFEGGSESFLSDSKIIESNIFIDRLCNRLGENKVNGICEVADYRPELSMRFCSLGDSEKGIGKNFKKPSWLLSKPIPLKNNNKLPEYNGPLELIGLPYRIESGWWDGFDIARDYFVALNSKREKLWIFYNRRSKEWFLHGFF